MLPLSRSRGLALLSGVWVVLSVTMAAASDRAYFFHNDHLGTPQAMTDLAGRTVWTAEYEPFGKVAVDQDPDGDGQQVVNNLRFPGQYYDAESGLHYNYYRDYDPETGRYLQPDPIGLNGGPNIYGYTGANPINQIDPYGLTWSSNWHFFWDWVTESGEQRREYGEGTVELQEIKTSPGAAKMRAAYRAGNCKNIYNGSFGTIEAYFKTAYMPNSTAFQVGGFLYDAENGGNNTATYTVKNQASLYSLLLHLPGIPHKPRGGNVQLFGNIDQIFRWTEPSACCQ